jgi:hypothetical protein
MMTAYCQLWKVKRRGWSMHCSANFLRTRGEICVPSSTALRITSKKNRVLEQPSSVHLKYIAKWESLRLGKYLRPYSYAHDTTPVHHSLIITRRAVPTSLHMYIRYNIDNMCCFSSLLDNAFHEFLFRCLFSRVCYCFPSSLPSY